MAKQFRELQMKSLGPFPAAYSPSFLPKPQEWKTAGRGDLPGSEALRLPYFKLCQEPKVNHMVQP